MRTVARRARPVQSRSSVGRASGGTGGYSVRPPGRHWGRALRTPLGACAAALLAVMALIAVLAPVLWTGTANAFDTSAILRGPSPAHWAGTNNLGQDVFFQVLVATRLTAALALAATAIGVGTGLLLGTAPLVLGRRAGRVITAVVNIAVAFPALLLALFFAVIFGVGARGALLAIGFASAPTFARLTRTLSASVAGLDYIAAARIAGVSRVRLLTRHVLPNIGETLIVNATISAGDALLSFAGLSFLGLGVQAPSYDWGKLLNDGLNGIYVHPVAALAPGIAVILAGLAFNLFGEAMARALGVPELAGGAIVRAARTGRGARRARAAASPGSTPSTAPPFSPTEPDDCVLSVRDLRVSFPGGVHPVRGVSLTLRRGEAVGVVGESGSGKSLTALAIARLLEPPAAITADQVRLLGRDLLLSPGGTTPRTPRGAPDGKARVSGTRPRGMDRHFLGTSLGMVFQDPMTSFNPVRHVGGQLAEVATQHQGMTRRQAAARAVDRLRAVRIPGPERRYRQFPHELSGGMRQRAMIGMAVMGSPALVIADEPTTALDVTVQRAVLRLIKSIQAADDLALLFISHDITVVGQVCDRVLVMYAGRIVESLPSAALAASARHPYTRALLAAVPSMETDREQPLAVVPGRPADPADVRPGCAFAPRCAFADDQCRAADPVLASAGDGHQVACWHPQAAPAPITLLSGAAAAPASPTTPATPADARETT
jgi:peptide/nickel transport system permease protein